MPAVPDTGPEAGSNLVSGNGTNVATFTLPSSPRYVVQSVVATVDNSAGADTTATLTMADSNGAVIAKRAQGETLDAGASRTATFALRLSGNSGGALRWGTNTDAGAKGLTLNGRGAFAFNITGGGGWSNTLNGGGYSIDTGGGGHSTATQGGGYSVTTTSGGIELDASPGGSVQLVTRDGSLDGAFIELNPGTGQVFRGVFDGSTSWTADGNLELISNGDMSIYTQAGGSLEIDAFGGVARMIASNNTAAVAVDGSDGSVRVSGAKLGFYGHAAVTQPGTPVTLGDVIAALQSLGLVA